MHFARVGTKTICSHLTTTPPNQTLMKNKSYFAAVLGMLAVCSMPQVNAASITLGGPLPTNRTATLDSAQAGANNSTTGSGNATAASTSAFFGVPYTERGSVAGNGGPGNYASGQLNIQVLTGSWGGNGPLTGNWTITNAAFWTTFGNAAISLHVGNGGGGPDHFIWKLTQGAQSGSWSYSGVGLGGGGLSNLKLYSNGTAPGTGDARGVPDGGTTIACLGMALLGLGSMRRFIASKA